LLIVARKPLDALSAYSPNVVEWVFLDVRLWGVL
jgi:hypothetical protein